MFFMFLCLYVKELVYTFYYVKLKIQNVALRSRLYRNILLFEYLYDKSWNSA